MIIQFKYYLLIIWAILVLPLYGEAQDNSGDFKDVTFISDLDGSKQNYLELVPKNFDVKKSYDLIIALHGHGADRWQFAKDARSECLAFRTITQDRRMIAVLPDYRAPTSWMGAAAEADLQQIIKQLRKKYSVDNVFLIGASMGGTAALTFSALHPGLIDGVTAMNAHSNHLEFENFQDAISTSFGGNKTNIPEEYKKRSAEYWPERLTIPLAITIGTTDDIVPPGSMIRLSDVLKKLDQQVLFIQDEESGHTTSFENAITAMKYMLNTVAEKQTNEDI